MFCDSFALVTNSNLQRVRIIKKSNTSRHAIPSCGKRLCYIHVAGCYDPLWSHLWVGVNHGNATSRVRWLLLYSLELMQIWFLIFTCVSASSTITEQQHSLTAVPEIVKIFNLLIDGHKNSSFHTVWGQFVKQLQNFICSFLLIDTTWCTSKTDGAIKSVLESRRRGGGRHY